MAKNKYRDFLLIVLGSTIYAAATQLFIFPHSLFLGGTSGISVILNHFFPEFSSGTFLMVINLCLMLLALFILGKNMAVRTWIGSALTTLFIGALEYVLPQKEPLISQPILSAVIGASAIALGSAILFYTDSSSGGTDIIALIIRKYSNFPIGKALFVTDVLIVVFGACLSTPRIAAASVAGLFIKTFGIDWIMPAIRRAAMQTKSS